jgi:hypothetical protein
MKTYTILYAEDVPHYGTREIEAADDHAAVEVAKNAHADGSLDLYDPDWNNTVCKRIVTITDGRGDVVAEDISLDSYRLEYGTDEEHAISENAKNLLDTLEFVAGHALMARTNYGPDAEQSVRNRNSSLEELERRSRAAIAKARGQA